MGTGKVYALHFAHFFSSFLSPAISHTPEPILSLIILLTSLGLLARQVHLAQRHLCDQENIV